MGLGNYAACKYFRRFTRELTPEEHGNVFCVTHPDSEGQCSADLTVSVLEVEPRKLWLSRTNVRTVRGRFVEP